MITNTSITITMGLFKKIIWQMSLLWLPLHLSFHVSIYNFVLEIITKTFEINYFTKWFIMTPCRVYMFFIFYVVRNDVLLLIYNSNNTGMILEEYFTYTCKLLMHDSLENLTEVYN